MSAAQTDAEAVAFAIAVSAKKWGLSLDWAAKRLCRLSPEICGRVMDRVGNWPSSTPELAALQRAWGKS